MKSTQLQTKNRAFTSVEVLLSVSLFTLLILLVIRGISFSQYWNKSVFMQKKSVTIAQEGLEIVKEIRNQSFLNLIDGTYGLSKNNGYWEFIPTPDLNDNIYKRAITTTSINNETK